MSERRIAVPATPGELTVLTGFLQDFWADAQLPAGLAPAVELALEEVFMNVVTHGVPPGREVTVDVVLALSGEDLTMTIADDGPAFDPLTLADPDVTAGLDERPVGKLGVYLVKHVMDTVTYAREGHRNRLAMTKRVAG